MKKNGKWLKPLIAIIFVLVVWQLVGMSGIYPAFILPTPLKVITTLFTGLFSGDFLWHAGVSLKRQISGFFWAVVVGLPLGILLANFKGLKEYVLPPLKMIYPIPALAFLPLTILWLGLGDRTVIFIIFFGSFWPIMFNTMAGIQNVNPVYRKASKVLGATTLSYWFRILLPASLPYILTGTRLAFGTSWRQIVGAEMISGSSGLGFMIDHSRSLLRGDEIIAGMIIIAAIGYTVEMFLFDYLEKKTVRRWGEQLQ